MRSLDKIERAAATAAASREYLEKEIRVGHANGLSLRAMAKAADLSHEQIRRVLAK